ncbi:MAG: response regulator transcription factor [Anaerolineae bacterium]|nr:response regulator transcription factor [Anaerolineae bacterium]
MRAGQSRILVVDDKPRYLRLIKVNLEASGYEVITTDNGAGAVDLAATETPDLILLDIMLPHKDGYQACREIRAFSGVPIIMLTALGQTDDVVKGLNAGADDYICKPFSAQELLARIRARLRRVHQTPQQETETVYRIGGAELDLTRRRLFVRGDEVHLTPTEYRLVTELISNAGRVLVPGYLLEQVWGSEENEPQLVWQAIHRLRRKIERDPSDPVYIQTRPGIGYIFLGEDTELDE